MNTFAPKHIAFVEVNRYNKQLLETWGSRNHPVGSSTLEFHLDAMFVSVGALKELAVEFRRSKYTGKRVMASCPAPMSKFWSGRAPESRAAGWPRFGTGHYYDPDELLFMDDYIEFVHHHRELANIRTAKQLAVEFFLIP